MLLDQLLISLRRKGDEAQLTQALAAFASQNGRFASELLAAWLDHADPEKVGYLGPVPGSLKCRAEVTYGQYGRVDLEFSNSAESFLVLVELKIYAGYGDEQLLRYVRAARQSVFERTGVLAITRDVPVYGEVDVGGEPEWLGSVRWGKSFDTMLAISSEVEPQFTETWRSFLNACKSKGDFGTVANPEDLTAWARYSAGKQTLIGIMNEIAVPAQGLVCDSLDGSPGEAASLIVHKSRTVWPWQDRINLQIGVAPSLDAERLRIQFLAVDGRLYFTVEARFPDTGNLGSEATARIEESTQRLRSLDPPFSVGKDWEHYWARVHPAEDWLGDPDNIHEQLLEYVQTDVAALVDSGIFDALPATPGHASHEPDTSVAD